MEEVLKSIKAFLYDRSTSPLFGAFVVSWSLWNYRLLAILLSAEPVNIRFASIDAQFRSEAFNVFGYEFLINGHLIHGFLVPAAATAFYIYIYPLLAKPVYAHSLKRQKELRDIKLEKEALRLLSVEESRELYKRISQMQGEFEKEAESYRKQIESLTHTINELERDGSDVLGDAVKSNGRFSTDDLARYGDLIQQKIETMPPGDFELAKLFDRQEWANLSVDARQTLGRSFRRGVERGDFPNVSLKKKGAGGQLIYTKLTTARSTLSEREQHILSCFSGLSDNEGLTAKDVKDVLGGHIDEIRLHIENLVDNHFLQVFGQTEANEKLYALQSRGRRYLVDNELLASIP